MLGEEPFVIQEDENKKEIGNLSPSNNDRLTRSQSLFHKITLDSSNSQDVFNNLYLLKSINKKINGKDFLTVLKHAFYLDEKIDSNYVHKENTNIELRLSNHCADSIEAKRYDKSTSIVVSPSVFGW